MSVADGNKRELTPGTLLHQLITMVPWGSVIKRSLFVLAMALALLTALTTMFLWMYALLTVRAGSNP